MTVLNDAKKGRATYFWLKKAAFINPLKNNPMLASASMGLFCIFI
ncbi:hypothetical protein [Bacillus thuringiensis]|nr:hypothetical protein [Bacillus thuringiensis]